MASLRTEFPFTLPKGFVDADGAVHTQGTMRLATARDELEPLKDPKVKDADDPYLTVIVLARVITRLGPHTRLSPRDVEQLFAADLAHLQDVYSTVNYGTPAEIDRLLSGAAERSAAAPTAVAPPLSGSVSGGSPVSDAARALLAGADDHQHPAAGDAFDVDDPVGASEPRDGGADDEHDHAQVLRRAPRRGRIEEVGRGSGPRGGAA